MKFFLVLVITLGSGKPPDAFTNHTIFDSLAQCELTRQATAGIAQRLVGTRKTDGTQVIDARGVCVEGTAAEAAETIKARAIRKRQS
jgi:hypothetical protein